MGILQGKGIWTLYNDINYAVDMAPQVGAEFILCKTTNRGKWSETTAQKAMMEVRRNGDLKPVAWTYCYFEDVAAEVDAVRRAFAMGFEAYVVDAEATINLKFTQATQFANGVRNLGIDLSRIYLCTDPRLDAKIDEIPMPQLAPVCQGGFIPMIYGEILPNDREHAAQRLFDSSYTQFERHKNTLGYTSSEMMPAFATYWDNQGHARMNYVEFKKWCDESSARQPNFVSLYRAGVTSPEAWRAFREMIVVAEGQVPVDNGPGIVDVVREDLAIVAPDGEGYSEGFYPPAQPGGWSQFVDKSGHLTKYRTTSGQQTMYAQYDPALPAAGRYVVETYVPGTHATSRFANYFVTYYDELNERCQDPVILDQQNYSDMWVPLGVFDLTPAKLDSGRVNLVDVTRDANPRELAFTAVRWRIAPTEAGYDAPVGTLEERAGQVVWPGRWNDANPYTSKYSLGYHTGADLNLNWPSWDLDRGAPVYAISDGVVTFAAEVGGAWQAVIVVKHDPLPDGTPVYSRYGHVDNIMVRAGQQVARGEQLAKVGQSGGNPGNYHLHFDISCTNILGTNPQNWPGFDIDSLRRNYVDPLAFIRAHRPK